MGTSPEQGGVVLAGERLYDKDFKFSPREVGVSRVGSLAGVQYGP